MVGDPIRFAPGTCVVAADRSLTQSLRFSGIFLVLSFPVWTVRSRSHLPQLMQTPAYFTSMFNLLGLVFVMR